MGVKIEHSDLGKSRLIEMSEETQNNNANNVTSNPSRHIVTKGDEPIGAIDAGVRPSDAGISLSDDTYNKKISSELMHTIQRLNFTAARLDDYRVLSRFHILGWLVTLVCCPIIFLTLCFYMPDEWKLKAVTIVMGTSNSWEAGNTILSKTDLKAYKQSMTANRISDDNKIVLKKCFGSADALDGPVKCEIIINPKTD